MTAHGNLESPIEPPDDSAEAPPALSPDARPRRGRRMIKRLVVFVAMFYVAWCAALFVFQDRLLFCSDLAPDPLPMKFNARTVELTLDTGQGRVVAWFIPAPGLTPGERAPTAVCFHGNAEIIDYQDTFIQLYQALGCNVLLPEYRGYGRSAGRPSESALVADAVRFYDLLRARPDVDPARIVFHGRSLGGGPATGLALQRLPAAIILESTFTSAADMAARYWVPSFLARHPFRVAAALERLDVPVLIFHGIRDDIIPVSHGRRLAAAARRGTYREFDCAHNDFPGVSHEEDYRQDIERFLVAAGVVAETAP